ncbi:MAG: Asp-tRNA(Asn)/Glu-tRNA(Gln) amidotransferase subunit GatC, partial [Patescibacteria group bacterium]
LQYNGCIMKSAAISASDVARIATLAKIPVTTAEEKKLAIGFNATLSVVDKLFSIDTSTVAGTHQVTGLVNVFREDEVDVVHMLSQEEALANASRYYNGFFVVDQIIEQG